MHFGGYGDFGGYGGYGGARRQGRVGMFDRDEMMLEMMDDFDQSSGGEDDDNGADEEVEVLAELAASGVLSEVDLAPMLVEDAIGGDGGGGGKRARAAAARAADPKSYVDMALLCTLILL